MAPRFSPVWLVLIGILSVQLGAAIAKDLFDVVSPTGMVWLRLVTSALVLGLLARPALRGRTRDDWLVVIAFGVTLGVMNWAIYQSFARIPLGIAVTIEFVGPLALAVIGSRRARDLVWVGLAALGVLLLGVQPGDVNLPGVLFALLAGAAWAAYILLSARTGTRWPGLDGLAVASVVATLLLTPLALSDAGDALLDPKILALGAAVGLLSSVIPYSCELTALRTHQARRVLDPDEPGARGRGAGRDPRARRVPLGVPVAGHGLRGRRLGRRDQVGADDRRAGAGLVHGTSSHGLHTGLTRSQALPPSVVDMFLIHRWAARSLQGSRRNAMVATTELSRRRVERDEVEAFLADRADRADRVGRRTAEHREVVGAITASR